MRCFMCLLAGILAMSALPCPVTAQSLLDISIFGDEQPLHTAPRMSQKRPGPPKGSLAWAHRLLHLRCIGMLCHARDNEGGRVVDFELAARVVHKHYQSVVYHPGRLYASSAVYAAALLGKNGSACLQPGTVFKVHQEYDEKRGQITKLYNTTDVPLFDQYAKRHGGLPHPDRLMTIPYRVAKQAVPLCTLRTLQRTLGRR